MNFLWFPEDAPASPSLLGGKAAQLAFLTRTGQPVPPWCVLTTELFTHALGDRLASEPIARLLDEALRGSAPPEQESRAIQALLAAEAPDEAVVETVRAACGRLAGGRPLRLAVRSSAVGEDGDEASYAGQFSSFLYVEGEAALLEAVRGCWASAFSPRALWYRKQRGGAAEGIRMAVILQEMIEPDAAGVLFTADPTTGARDVTVINAAYGCGEGVVQGLVDTDSFTVHPTGAVHRRLAEKRLRVGPGGRLLPVPERLRARPALTDAEARALDAAGRAVEEQAGAPQDVEWAIAGGRLFLLQTRPVTALPDPAPSGEVRLWDNSNIIESYPGVTTPLTYGFAQRAYENVYRQFCRVMGVPARTIRRHEGIFGEMIGLVRGRIYYNLRSWYTLVSLLPGYRFNRRFMEQMMGVSEAADLAPAAPPAGPARRIFVELPRTLFAVLRLAFVLLTHERRVERFTRLFERSYGEVRVLRLDRMPLDALRDVARSLEDRLLRSWKAPIITDFFTMVFYGTLRGLCRAWLEDRDGSLQNDLLCGQGNVRSAEPTRALLRMAARVRRDGAMRRAYERTPDEALWAACRRDPALMPLLPDLTAYLDAFGDRFAEELKLETPDLRDDPAFLFRQMRGYLAGPDAALETIEAREAGIRVCAEGRVRDALAGRPLRRMLFGWVLGQARRHVRRREQLRLNRAQLFGVARRIFRAAGMRLHELGVLDDPRDVFYLKPEELWQFTAGTGPGADLRGLASLRKDEFEAYRAGEAPPPRFRTRGPVGAAARFEPSQPAAPARGLRGTGACPGRVEGVVRVVERPEEARLEPGEILVAERTDPGWVPLFVSAAGLLVERGSLLSHSAIVAREFGLPTIVGIPGLTRTLRTGDRVRLDGATGVVERLENREGERVERWEGETVQNET